MKTYEVKLQMKANYEATLRVEGESVMDAFDKAQQVVKTGQVQATFVNASQLRIVGVHEAPEE